MESIFLLVIYNCTFFFYPPSLMLISLYYCFCCILPHWFTLSKQKDLSQDCSMLASQSVRRVWHRALYAASMTDAAFRFPLSEQLKTLREGKIKNRFRLDLILSYGPKSLLPRGNLSFPFPSSKISKGFAPNWILQFRKLLNIPQLNFSSTQFLYAS